MAKPRDPAVTEYVRMRVKPMLDAKELTGKILAERVGVSEAYISALMNPQSDKPTGVGGKSVDGFARLLRFANEEELRSAAYDWYRNQGAKAAVRLEDPAAAEAIRVLRGLYPLVSEDRWRAIAARFDHPDFDERSTDYWMTAFGQEVAQDAMKAARTNAAKEQAAKETRRDAVRASRVIRDGFVAAQREKKTLEGLLAAKPPEVSSHEEPELRAKRRG